MGISASIGIVSLATAVPNFVLKQTDVAVLARRVYGKAFERFPQLADVFVNAGIEQRYSARPIEWFDEPHDWSDRTKAYLEDAGDLFVTAAQQALDRAGITAKEVDVIVTVSSTGIATPSLDSRACKRMGFRPDVMRAPVFGLGCAGGVSGLALGARLARANPGENVLVIVIELCTLAFRGDRGFKADVISSALFGDGAAAMVLRAGDKGAALSIGYGAEHTWPNSLDIMGWTVDPAGFGVVLSRSLPEFIERNLAAPVRDFIEAAGLTAPHLIFHPGGAKVLDAIETALELQKGSLRDEREVLRDHGNMSAPSALFVLERSIKRGLRGSAVLSAMGPGFTASFVALECAP
jgi:alkylresorcinol/alkylpyrone synthase